MSLIYPCLTEQNTWQILYNEVVNQTGYISCENYSVPYYILTWAFSCSSAQDTLACLRGADVNSFKKQISTSVGAVFTAATSLSLSSMRASSSHAQQNFWRQEELTGFVDSTLYYQFMIMNSIGCFAWNHQYIRRYLICRSEHGSYGPSSRLCLPVVPQLWSSGNQRYRRPICRFGNEYFPSERHLWWMWVALSKCITSLIGYHSCLEFVEWCYWDAV